MCVCCARLKHAPLRLKIKITNILIHGVRTLFFIGLCNVISAHNFFIIVIEVNDNANNSNASLGSIDKTLQLTFIKKKLGNMT